MPKLKISDFLVAFFPIIISGAKYPGDPHYLYIFSKSLSSQLIPKSQILTLTKLFLL